jgi:hypothetical protein
MASKRLYYAGGQLSIGGRHEKRGTQRTSNARQGKAPFCPPTEPICFSPNSTAGLLVCLKLCAILPTLIELCLQLR